MFSDMMLVEQKGRDEFYRIHNQSRTADGGCYHCDMHVITPLR